VKYLQKFRALLVTSTAMAAIVLLVLVACSSDPGTTPGSTPLSASALTPTYDPTNSSSIDFVSAVQKVLPSVVKVEVTFGPQGAPGNPTASGGAGSGWVIDRKGLIVTNNHVVDGAQTINVVLPDGTSYTPTAVQKNTVKDLAVLKINAQNLTPANTVDSSQLQPGQPVAALGNALNLGIRVTAGVVSQLNVPANYNNISLTGLIETDATINPGNSGGPLINIQGQVVGITNAGLQAQNLDAENFGYAISTSEAMPVINTLISQMP
jgi:serine protease Do